MINTYLWYYIYIFILIIINISKVILFQVMLNMFRSSNTSGSSGSINNAEIVEYSQTQQLNQWTIPSISSKKIYKKGMFDFISQNNIKTVEQSIALKDSEQTLKLLSPHDIERYLSKYNYIHVGCVQVAFKPFTMQGLNAIILAYLRDRRCLQIGRAHV